MRKIWFISALLGMLTACVLFLFLSKQTSEPANLVQKTIQEPESAVSDAFQEETTEPGDSAQSNLSITYGKRAVTIAVNDIQGVAGALKKDDYVDVISLVSPASNNRFISQIVLQQIKVLAVGSYRPYTPAAPEAAALAEAETALAEPETALAEPETVPASETAVAVAEPEAVPASEAAGTEAALPYAMVTLEVLPEEGAKLALAASSGNLVLMLRPRKDPTGAEPEQFTTDQLIKGEIIK